MEIVEHRVFNNKRELKEGMKEIKHFTPPCEYEYEFFECELAFPRPSKRTHYGVDVLRRDEKTTDYCAECEFNNAGECDRPEEE